MIKNIISVIYTEIRFAVLKLFFLNRFSYKGIQRFSPGTEITIDKGARVTLGKKVRAHTGTRIRARENAEINIGDDVAFGYNCMLTAQLNISIGNGCEIGPGVLFYDHDHNVHGYSIKEKKFNRAPVVIGENVWIGANAIILRGTVVGDNSVIAAGAIVKGHYPENTIIVQKRATDLLPID